MTSNWTQILGDVIIKNTNDVTKSECLCGKGSVIGLYFSAIWCPSCIAFTPDLIKLYSILRNGDTRNFEVIYISSDKDESQFKEQLKTMPWLALPFNEKDRQVLLSRKFHVQSIPSLILVDGESGEVINPNGKACVVDDPQGIGFPWRLRDPIEVFHEMCLISTRREEQEFSSLSGIKGLYFSAHWCPPCRAFTPILVKLYKKLQQRGKKFQVIFISSDRSAPSFEQYFSTMPWFAVSYSDEARRKELAHLYGVGGIPSLIILDDANNIITKDGRAEVNDDPEGEDFPWRPKLVDELTEKHVSKLNEEACLIYFAVGDDKELEAAFYILLPVAEEYQARTQRAICEEKPLPRLNFFYGGDAEICDSVRDIVNAGDDVPFLAILDIPNSKKYVSEIKSQISTEVIRRFVRDFICGKLTSDIIKT